jgi:hypothetical protein
MSLRSRFGICLIGASLFSLAVTANTQDDDHTPTAEQCRADLALWYDVQEATAYFDAETAHINEGTPNRTEAAKLPFTKVVSRLREMGACWRVEGFKDRYFEAHKFYSDVMHDRYDGFLRRHNLMEQLKREDAEGLR